MFCKKGQLPSDCSINSTVSPCHCIHRIKVPLNSVVELIVVDEVNSIGSLVSHPFHLHGYRLFVTEINQNPYKERMTVETAKMMVQKSRKTKSLPTNRKYPIKDTISIPRNGYTIFRFKADNPGFWLMHCHYEWHLETGMGLIFQVGETHEMVPPPNDFPKCNNYSPPNKLLGVLKPQWIQMNKPLIVPDNCHVGGLENVPNFKGSLYIARKKIGNDFAIGKYIDEKSYKKAYSK